MRTLLNIIWFLFGGLPLFLGYLLAGVVACIFVVTIPAGVACFRIAGYVLWPFGKSVVDQPSAQAVTIVGIPLAIANLKMIPITCFPFGKAVIDDPTASIL